MSLYKKFVNGLVMNHYNKLLKDTGGVLFSPSYGMSGIRSAVKVMTFSLLASIIFLPTYLSMFFIWLFLCSSGYKGSVESKMNNGYPYLEVGDAMGLFVYYLIMIPVAGAVYLLFSGGYELTVELLNLNHILGFVFRLVVLLLVWISYMLLFRDKKWDKRNEQWKERFKSQELQIEVDRKNQAQKNGNYADFVKGLKGKFKEPKDIKDLGDIKDPVVSKKRLGNFIEWVKTVSKDTTRGLDLTNSIVKNKKLNITVPEIKVLFCVTKRFDGIVNVEFLDETGASVYMITDVFANSTCDFKDNKKWVAIFNNEKITYEVVEDIYGYSEPWEEIGAAPDSEELYLEEGDWHIPYNNYEEFYNNEDVYPGYSDGDYCLYCTQNVEFLDVDFIVNDEKFSFYEYEKEHLVTLLMASYKPSLLKRILEELE